MIRALQALLLLFRALLSLLFLLILFSLLPLLAGCVPGGPSRSPGVDLHLEGIPVEQWATVAEWAAIHVLAWEEREGVVPPVTLRVVPHQLDHDGNPETPAVRGYYTGSGYPVRGPVIAAWCGDHGRCPATTHELGHHAGGGDSLHLDREWRRWDREGRAVIGSMELPR